MTWHAFLLTPPQAQQQEKHVPGRPSVGWAQCQWQARLPGQAVVRGNFISRWVSVGWPQRAAVSLSFPSLQAQPKLPGLEWGTEATTPVSDWLQGIPNGTPVSLALKYFTGGAAATSLEILLAHCRTRF